MSAPAPGWHVWLLVVPVASILYDVVAQAAFRRWMREPLLKNDRPLEPITFFRPLKRGVPQLREKVEMLVRNSRAGDQIIFGVEAESEEESICEEVRRTFPERDLAVVRCAPDAALNPKIAKLVQMEVHARHASWLLSDSEAIFTSDFLTAFRGEWQMKRCAALTAPYRFVNLVSWPQRCDALGILLGLWPGLALVRRYARINLTLGACTLVSRDALAAIGGWRAFGEDLAEDQRLGAVLAREGQTVCLSRHTAALDSDAMSWRDYWRHQRRVAVTYRVVSPAGFAGVILTFGPVWSLVCALAFPQEPRIFLALVAAVAFRGLNVWKMTCTLAFRVPGLPVVFCIASLVEALCWLLSWFTSTVWWGGRRWRVDFRGKLSATAPR